MHRVGKADIFHRGPVIPRRQTLEIPKILKKKHNKKVNLRIKKFKQNRL